MKPTVREILSPAEVLKVFEKHPDQTFRLRELVVELGLRSSQARPLKQVLKELVRGRRIVFLKKNHYALVRKGRQPAAATVPRGLRSELRPRAGEGHNLVRGRLIGQPEMPTDGFHL